MFHPRSSHPERAKKFAGGPVSRILSRTAIPLGASLLPALTATYPEVSAPPQLAPPQGPRWRAGPARARRHRAACETPSLFGLAPCGVYHASAVTAGAVRSYRTFSPLPSRLRAVAVCFLWHWPSRAP